MQHNHNSQNRIYGEIKSIPLRIIAEVPERIIEYEALEVVRKKLDDSVFAIPDRSKLKPYE